MEAYRERVRQAYWASLQRPVTAAQRLQAERRERQDARRAAGKAAPVDYLRKAMDLFRERGYAVERVEWYDAALRRRHDLFGCVDAVALGHGHTLGIQATSWDNAAARAKKMRESKMLSQALDCGWKAVVVGFKKAPNGRYTHREIWIDDETVSV